MPPDAGLAHFLKRYKLDSRKSHYFDMIKYCRCDPNINTLLVYYSFDYDFHLMEPEYAFSNEGKLWTDPQWKILPSRFCSLLAHFTELVPIRDMRQNFLVEDLLEHFDVGTLCGASMFLDRGAQCACLLQDLHHVETSIRALEAHTSTEVHHTNAYPDIEKDWSVANDRESTETRIIELIPGLQDIRQTTLPQMYFEDCSVLRGTFGRVNPLFQHPEDAVMIIWKPGDYDHVYFMFMSQLYPHHEHFKIHDWSMIVFSREATGAIKRRVPDSPAQGNVPPDADDPIHPDQHGGDLLPEDVPIDDGSNDFLDDDNQPDFNTGPDPGDDDDDDDDDDQEYIIPDDQGPPPDDDLDMPGIQDSGETQEPSVPSTLFSNPDVPIEEIADPGQDDDPPPGPDKTSEPIRVQRKQQQISVDSADALPKAKAKVIVKKPKVKLPAHVQPISVPSVKPVEDPQEASSSNDPSIPLPTTTLTSFMPGDFAQPDRNPSTQGTPEMVPA